MRWKSVLQFTKQEVSLIWPCYAVCLMQTEEFRGLVAEEYYDWVAQYLVVKRASIEPNFHNLYMSFMDMFASAYLRKGVIRETYRNIKVWCTELCYCKPAEFMVWYGVHVGDSASRQDKQ